MLEFKSISEFEFEIIIDSRIFSQDVIFKTTTWFIDKYCFYYNQIDTNLIQVKIVAKGHNSYKIDDFKNKFNFYINDYKTREIIYNQTKSIRDILMVKAFSRLEDFNEEMILL